MRRLKKSIFKGGAAGLIVLLAVIRCVFPGVSQDDDQQLFVNVDTIVAPHDSIVVDTVSHDSLMRELRQQAPEKPAAPLEPSGREARISEPIPFLGDAPVFVDDDGQRLKNKIYSVRSYQVCFPDVQDVQIQAATYWGVRPVENRAQAEQRMNELVYVGSNPYYMIDPMMRRSIPYLVPRAADLLQTIAKNFLDSLAIKQIPAHKIMVSSVLRTEEDVRRLRTHNGNASENSCHRYGTTFDITYRHYQTVAPPGEKRREVRDDTLKFVLSEVLNDVRRSGRCYVKYEMKQACFHITVR